MQDRDDKYEASDESEYHFSDEDVSYEVDSEPSKASPNGGIKEARSFHFSPSKRMLVSLVVFIGLVFVVYKMVSPSTTQGEIGEIAAAPTVQHPSKQSAAEIPKASQPNMLGVIPSSMPQQPMQAPQQMVQQPMVVAPPVQPVIEQPTNQNMIGAQTTQQAMVSSSTQPMQGVPIQQQPTATMVPTIQANNQASPMSPMQSPAPAMPQQQPSPYGYGPGATQVASMPPVIPVQPNTPISMPTAGSMNLQNPAVEARVQALNTDGDKLISKLQEDYTEKLNSFSSQNKALQDQMQTLSARMATMESQLTQLVEALTQPKPEAPATLPAVNSNIPAPASVVEPRISYNVQAIIPGRAWLRSDNGETITVAEGDVIKDLGRVMKIDPYDGIVQINTGTKAISLSYGTGA